MMNEATFGSDDSFMTVGEMSSTTIDNCVLYSAPERHELSMAFNFHHLKVDYEDGQKWTITPFDFEELKRLYHTWCKEMSERGGWSALFWNNHDQPRALNRVKPKLGMVKHKDKNGIEWKRTYLPNNYSYQRT